MKQLRILLVDDHVLFRKALIPLINLHQHLIVGEASNGEEAIALALETKPDLILMDVNMPKCNGVQATKIIKEKLSNTQIVMLTVSEEDRDLFEALKNGAGGYLLKNLKPRELFDMLDAIANNQAPLVGKVSTKILNEFRKPDPDKVALLPSPELKRLAIRKSLPKKQESYGIGPHYFGSPTAGTGNAKLTEREMEVMELLVTGATNKEIARTLSISENTVKIHLRHMREKLHAQNRLQVAVTGVRQHLVG